MTWCASPSAWRTPSTSLATCSTGWRSNDPELAGGRPPRHHLGEAIAIDVAAAQDEPDPLAAHALALDHEGGEGGGARTLGEIVGVLIVGAHGLGDLILRDAHDPARAAADEVDRLGHGIAAGQAVGEGGARWGRDWMPPRERQRHGGRPIGDDADD